MKQKPFFGRATPEMERKASIAKRQYMRATTHAQEHFFFDIYHSNGGVLWRGWLDREKSYTKVR